MDKLVAQALGKKPYDFVLANNKVSKQNVEAVRLDKKGQVHIDLTFSSLPLSFLDRQYTRARENEEGYKKTTRHYKTVCDYTVLDVLLHQRAHEETEEFEHSLFKLGANVLLSRNPHQDNFYDIKSRLRRKVVDYFNKQGIDLSDYADNCSPKYEEIPLFYFVENEDFAELCLMTRRRLRNERMKFDSLKIKESADIKERERRLQAFEKSTA